jgi:DNA-binding transcriptional LysR family regulator
MLDMETLSRFQSLAFDFKALDIFQAVYAASSMTEAARELEMTQSAVSQALSRLEERLGLSLFERSRPLVPSPAADELAVQVKNLFSEAQRMEIKVRERADTGRSVVRVGMLDSLTATIGPKLIPRLRGRANRLTVWSGISRTLEKELLAGKLDLMTSSRPMSGEKNIVAYPLLREPFFIVLPDQMARSIGDVRLRDLVHNHTFVRYSMRSKIGADIESYLEQEGLVPPQSLEFDGTEAAFAMVNGGLGWMISTPMCLIHGANVETGLTAVPLPAPTPSRALYLLARKDVEPRLIMETLKEAQQITRELLDTKLKPLAPWAVEMVRVG